MQMPFEFYISVIPFCVIPVFLVSLDYFKKKNELNKRNFNVIDFDRYVKRKENGDAIDNDIAELLGIDKIAV